jgi:hypothetical protein
MGFQLQVEPMPLYMVAAMVETGRLQPAAAAAVVVQPFPMQQVARA